MSGESKDLTEAFDKLNVPQTVAREEAQVQTINDRITARDRQMDNLVMQNMAMQDQIRANRETIRRLKAENTLDRRQRTIFSDSAHRLRRVFQP